MRIDVTSQDIALGKPGDGEICPIARAIDRATGDLAIVLNTVVHYYSVKGRRVLKLPHSARRFVSRFDNSEPVKPFSFELRKKGGAK